MIDYKQLEKKRTARQASLARATRPALPSMDYDENFATDGKLMLPFENRTGWASCIIPSFVHPATFIVGFYETLKIISPQPAYLARLVRLRPNGEVDPGFANGKGFIDANFAQEGISVISGIHETADGFYVWGNTVSLSDNSLVTRYFLSKLKADGQPDLDFGERGSLDINTLGLEYPVQLMPDQACIFSADGGIYVGVAASDASVALLLKLDSAGKLDPRFQNGGVAPITNDGKGVYPQGLAGTGQDGLFVFGMTVSDTEIAGVVIKYDRAGDKCSQFGNAGVSEVWVEGYYSNIAGLSVLDDTRLLLVGNADTLREGALVTESLATLLNGDGQPDRQFNAGEPVFSRFDPISDFDKWDVGLPQLPRLANMLIVGSGGSQGSTGPVVGRYNEDGSPDTSFANGYAFATVDDASFSPNGRLICTHPAPGQIFVAGSVSGRPAILALKV
ncbi:hypothetical protein [Pseudomonas phoenicis]|uniref:hypothetical protein n=1 Tax=unclassified Pseudomonas TaxID=196821 RepID=UPI0039A3E200